MAKSDSLREKINVLRDDYKNLFIFFMAIITGSFTIFFKIVTIQLKVYYAFFGIIGLIIALFVLIRMKKSDMKLIN